MCAPAHQRGFLLIAAVVIIMAAAVMALVIVTLVAGGSRAGTQHLQSSQALFLARTGLEHASRLLNSPVLADRLPCAGLAGDPAVTDAALGTGSYAVTGAAPFYFSPAPALAAALNAGDTTVMLSSSAGLAPAGRVLIDRETLHYAEISSCSGSPCLIGVQRERDGTTAVAHAAGAPVAQYQCNLTSVGSVPGASATERGQRTLGWGTQLQEGWIVGGAGAIVRFNHADSQPAVHNSWESAASPVTVQLNSIAMLSYADGWAVGNNSTGGGPSRGVILRWSGGPAWTDVGSTDNRSNLNGVHCVASNDCWAVGDRQGPGGVVMHWDGASWTRYTPANSIPATDLRSVYCVASDDCWAVGDAQGGEVIIHWNGADWSRVGPSGAIPNVDLNSVYCFASNACWAVGDFTPIFGPFRSETILQWNGANWTRAGPFFFFASPNLNSVHCADTDDCWAVGDTFLGNEFLLRWNGATWTAIAFSPAVPDVNLRSVHCLDADDCWAVGDTSGGAVLVHWDGAAWSRFDPTGLPNQDLYSVYLIGDHGRADAAWREIFP